jgi:hypothetical protein
VRACKQKQANGWTGSLASAPLAFADYMVMQGSAAFDDATINAAALLSFRTRPSAFGGKQSAIMSKSGTAFDRVALNFAAVGDSTGHVHFIDMFTGAIVHSHLCQSNAAPLTISSIAFDATADNPLLVVATQEGFVHAFRVEVRFNGVIVAGKRRANETISENANGFTIELKDTDTLFFKNTVAEPSDAQDTAAGRNISLAGVVHFRKQFIFLADQAGGIEFVHRNGTSIDTLSVGRPVAAVARAGASLAVATGKDIDFVALSQMSFMPHACHVTDSFVTSIAYDMTSPAILYAGTENGDIFIFNSKDRSTDMLSCSLIRRLSHRGDEPEPTTVRRRMAKLYTPPIISFSFDCCSWQLTFWSVILCCETDRPFILCYVLYIRFQPSKGICWQRRRTS